MPLTLPEVSEVIDEYGGTARQEWNRLARLDRYVEGKHDKPPFENSAEERRYRRLWDASTVNLVGLVVNAFMQRLAVDGYRADESDRQPSSTPWDVWTLSGMDAGQKRLYATAYSHGYSYLFAGATDSAPGALLRPVSGRQVWAHYDTPDDDWPEFAMTVRKDVWTVWDDEVKWTVPVDRAGLAVRLQATREPHKTGVVPFARIEDSWGSIRAHGVVAPLIALNDQINRLTFVLNLIGEHSSFQLRYMIGAKPKVDETTGQPVEPTVGPEKFLMVSDPHGKVGALDPTDPTGLRNYRNDLIENFCAIAQIPPHYATGRIANLSAESLLAAESTMAYNLDNDCRGFGVGIDRALRLGSAIAGDTASAEDRTLRVFWQPVQAQNLAATADAWGKAVTMLGVPQEATWTRLPGVTRQDADDWRSLRDREREQDPLGQLNRLMGGDVGGGDAR